MGELVYIDMIKSVEKPSEISFRIATVENFFSQKVLREIVFFFVVYRFLFFELSMDV